MDDDPRRYMQVAAKFRGQITDGWLTAGDRLPPVRMVREATGYAVGTIRQAYRVLAKEGLVRARGNRYYVK